MRPSWISSALVITGIVLALAVSGCARTVQPPAVPSGVTEAPSSIGAPGAGESVTDPGDVDGELPGAATAPMDPSEAESLEQELTAIERELESIDMPSDSDFEDIEGSL